MPSNWKDVLTNIYYDPAQPGSFSGPAALYNRAKKLGHKITHRKVKEFLEEQDVYTLHRPVITKFARNRVVSGGIDALWDSDLADVSSLHKQNDGVKFLLIAIDVFSRYLFVQTLNNKKHETIIKAFDKIFSSGRIPQRLRTDKGGEFKNRWFKKYTKNKGITHYVTYNQQKANYAERVIRTLKATMYKYFDHMQSHRYLDILQTLVSRYNNSPHRSLAGKSPNEINRDNEAITWKRMYVNTAKSLSKNKFTFKVGDLVRISHEKRVFSRDYENKWTRELFKISSRKMRANIPIYKLVDFHDEPIEGTFYASELQLVRKQPDDMWHIERVIKSRGAKGKKQYFVSWMGWPKSFNTWINEKDMITL